MPRPGGCSYVRTCVYVCARVVRTYARAPGPGRDVALSLRTPVYVRKYVRTYVALHPTLHARAYVKPLDFRGAPATIGMSRTLYPVRPRALGQAISHDMMPPVPRPHGVLPGTAWLQKCGCSKTHCRCTAGPLRQCRLYEKSPRAMEHAGGCAVPMEHTGHFFTCDFVPDGTSMEALAVEMTERYTSIQVRCTGPTLYGEGWLVLWASTPVSLDAAILGVCCAMPVVSETRPCSERVPPQLISTMAAAALIGIPVSDLETFDEWQERLKAESQGQDMEVSNAQLWSRKKVVDRFTQSQLEEVSQARKSGLLTRLQHEPDFLMIHVQVEAESARKRALDARKRLAEYDMLSSIPEPVAPALWAKSGSSSSDRPQAREAAAAAAARFQKFVR